MTTQTDSRGWRERFREFLLGTVDEGIHIPRAEEEWIAFIESEKSLSERQGAQDFVKLIKETAPSYECPLGTVYRVGEWTLKTPWMDFSDRTQQAEGEPGEIKKL